MRAIDVIVRNLADTCMGAMKGRPEPREQEQPETTDYGAPPQRRRSRRPTSASRANEGPRRGPAPAAPEAPAPQAAPAPVETPPAAEAPAPIEPPAGDTPAT